MYFITTNKPGYVLFCTTPSERGALGLTDKQVVHFLVRTDAAAEWTVAHQWNAADYSHTDFLALLHHRDEPHDPAELLKLLPESVRPRQH